MHPPLGLMYTHYTKYTITGNPNYEHLEQEYHHRHHHHHHDQDDNDSNCDSYSHVHSEIDSQCDKVTYEKSYYMSPLVTYVGALDLCGNEIVSQCVTSDRDE